MESCHHNQHGWCQCRLRRCDDRVPNRIQSSRLFERHKRLCGAEGTTLLGGRGRLLARRASRRPGTPLERKMDAFGRPNSVGKGKLFSMSSLSILIYLKRNSFNSHYQYNYTFDILITLMVYLAE